MRQYIDARGNWCACAVNKSESLFVAYKIPEKITLKGTRHLNLLWIFIIIIITIL